MRDGECQVNENNHCIAKRLCQISNIASNLQIIGNHARPPRVPYSVQISFHQLMYQRALFRRTSKLDGPGQGLYQLEIQPYVEGIRLLFGKHARVCIQGINVFGQATELAQNKVWSSFGTESLLIPLSDSGYKLQKPTDMTQSSALYRTVPKNKTSKF